MGYGYADENDIIKLYTCSMRNVSRKLGISVKIMFKDLRELKILYYNDCKQNIPFDAFIVSGYFVVVEIRDAFREKPVTKRSDFQELLTPVKLPK